MSKKRFIQDVLIRNSPPLNKVNAGIDYAEQLWDKLSQRGYGDVKESGPREVANHYKNLSTPQKRWFDRFWHAFNKKEGRERAALAWSKLGDLDTYEYEKIVDAASAEALARATRDTTPPMAEKWLNERRFDDHTIDKKKADRTASSTERMKLRSELTGLEMMFKGNKDPKLEKQIKDIKKKLGMPCS